MEDLWVVHLEQLSSFIKKVRKKKNSKRHRQDWSTKWFDHSGEAKIMWEILQWEKISQQINLIKFELIF